MVEGRDGYAGLGEGGRSLAQHWSLSLFNLPEQGPRSRGHGEAAQPPPGFIPMAVMVEHGRQFWAQGTAGQCNLSENLQDGKANLSSHMEPAGSLLNTRKDFKWFFSVTT